MDKSRQIGFNNVDSSLFSSYYFCRINPSSRRISHVNRRIRGQSPGAKEEEVAGIQTRLSENILSLDTSIVDGERTICLPDVLKSNEDAESIIHDRE
jgi:hypothetical protein